MRKVERAPEIKIQNQIKCDKRGTRDCANVLRSGLRFDWGKVGRATGQRQRQRHCCPSVMPCRRGYQSVCVCLYMTYRIKLLAVCRSMFKINKAFFLLPFIATQVGTFLWKVLKTAKAMQNVIKKHFQNESEWNEIVQFYDIKAEVSMFHILTWHEWGQIIKQFARTFCLCIKEILKFSGHKSFQSYCVLHYYFYEHNCLCTVSCKYWTKKYG